MGVTAAIGISLIGMGVSAAGQARAGKQQQRVSMVNAQLVEEIAALNAQLLEEGTEANAGILEYNARMLESMSRDAIRRGSEDEERYALTGRQAIGAQRAGYAAQGIALDEGSPLDVQTDSAYQMEQDLVTIRTNAAREAWGFQVEAESERMQERALRKVGKIEAEGTRRVARTEALSARLGGNYAAAAGRTGAAATILGDVGGLLYRQYGFARNKK